MCFKITSNLRSNLSIGLCIPKGPCSILVNFLHFPQKNRISSFLQYQVIVGYILLFFFSFLFALLLVFSIVCYCFAYCLSARAFRHHTARGAVRAHGTVAPAKAARFSSWKQPKTASGWWWSTKTAGSWSKGRACAHLLFLFCLIYGNCRFFVYFFFLSTLSWVAANVG